MQRHLGAAKVVVLQRRLRQAEPRLRRVQGSICVGGFETGLGFVEPAGLLVAFAERQIQIGPLLVLVIANQLA